MINSLEKNKCTGCGACNAICPKDAIHMNEDKEGFLYPKIDTNKCIECNLCETICPVINKIKVNPSTVTYICQNNDYHERAESTSGGFFTLLAQFILDKSGYVYGVEISDTLEVKHVEISKKDDLYRLRGSKYVQSNLNTIFRNVKTKLDASKLVLFSGTPCQVAGLKKYLQKDYQNLILVDLACYGVPSPGLYRKWINYIENKYSKKINTIFFRDKSFGYASPSVKIIFTDKSYIEQNYDSKSFTATFFNQYNVRPSCYNCEFKGINRISDFTLADCWSVKHLNNNMDDNLGTTTVYIHSQKGVMLFDKICCSKKEVDTLEAINLDGIKMIKSAIPNPRRNEFWNDYQKFQYINLIEKYCPISIQSRLANFLKPLMKNSKSLKKLLKIVKKYKVKRSRK